MFNKIKKSNVLIIILILVAVVLGIAIYQKSNKDNLFSTGTSKSSSTPVPSRAPRSQNASNDPSRRPTPAGLTADERAVLSPPRPDSSDEEKKQHYDLVSEMSQTASVLSLNSCSKPSPLVLKLEEGQEFNVRNNDSEDHTIVIDEDHRYTIKANSQSTIKASFGRGKGAYGYLCDDLSGVVGFFFIAP